MAAIHIGISGWRYAPWRGDFYPKGLTQKRELQFASRAVNSIEINGSFYALQRPERYAQWYADTPPGFVFSVKGPRFITHIKRLRDIHHPLANFFASGVLELKEKLGPILWQFPPNFKFDPEVFENFLEQLPHDTQQAAALARQHDSHLSGHASLTAYEKKLCASCRGNPQRKLCRPSVHPLAQTLQRRAGDCRYGGQMAVP